MSHIGQKRQKSKKSSLGTHRENFPIKENFQLRPPLFRPFFEDFGQNFVFTSGLGQTHKTLIFALKTGF